MTLNMLRFSRINPKLSAYSQPEGIFDFNRTPLALLGMKAIVHERTKQRGAWASHGQRGFNIGPAPHHYRHYSIFVITTGGTRVSDTIEFFPSSFEMPTSTDRIINAARDLTDALQFAPCDYLRPNISTGLQQFRNVFSRAANRSKNAADNPFANPIPDQNPVPSPRVNPEASPVSSPRVNPVQENNLIIILE